MPKLTALRQPSDRTKNLSLDDLFRRNGFSIYSRPKNGPPIWARNGKKYHHAEVVSLLHPADVEDACFAAEMMRGMDAGND